MINEPHAHKFKIGLWLKELEADSTIKNETNIRENNPESDELRQIRNMGV